MVINDRIVEFSEYLADEARNVLIPYYRQQFTIENKSDLTPVTEVDRAVEKTIRRLIENNYPDHGIIGEEFGNTNENAEFVWVIDPIDGTKSFITGRPLFGTLIALVHNKKPVLGIIDQPIMRERWLGVNGYTTLNGKKISARSCNALTEAYFATTSPFLFEKDDLSKISAISKEARCTVYGGDCYSYAQVAMGMLDVVVESGLKNFDFCALVPVIENAGGIITDWQGRPLMLESEGKVIACGDEILHKQLLGSVLK